MWNPPPPFYKFIKRKKLIYIYQLFHKFFTNLKKKMWHLYHIFFLQSQIMFHQFCICQCIFKDSTQYRRITLAKRSGSAETTGELLSAFCVLHGSSLTHGQTVSAVLLLFPDNPHQVSQVVLTVPPAFSSAGLSEGCENQFLYE